MKTTDISEGVAMGDVGIMSVVVVAAGSSSRMMGVDKLELSINGLPVISHSLRVFDSSNLVQRVVVVTQSSRIEEFKERIAAVGFSKPIQVVAGGERRQDSVRAGIDEITSGSGETEFLAVHDGARPFVDGEMLKRGLDVARKIGAAVPVVSLKDTVKRVEHGLVMETLDRTMFHSVQTPQIFRADVLRAAHETVSDDVTDDASMVELAGGLVGVFEGSNDNIKITTPSDIAVANAIAGNCESTSEFRYGIGFDGHRLVDGGPLRLGGIDIEFDSRLQGHSDGDVLLHAVSSAILGAVGLGDLGSNFPSNDPAYAGVDSRMFVESAVAKADERGWRVVHVDATVIAQKPRLAGYVPAFKAGIADALGARTATVNVKVTSTDEVGAIGRGEGIAAQAIATLAK